jgi:hypothetical protein
MIYRCHQGSPKGAGGLSTGFQPISAKIVLRRFDRRMAFVPEGQADRSQARSAWVSMQRGPVPEGRLKSLSVPRIFVVETIFLMIPGTSCLATIVLSLRDKTIRPSKRLALS